MKQRETISEFYTLHRQSYTKAGQFNIYRREEFACDSTFLPPNRRDFYKISLVLNGQGIFSSADKTIEINGNAITFTNPLIPYS